MSGFPSDLALAALAGRGVEFLVVHGWLYEPAHYARVVADLDGRPSSLRLVSVAEWGGGEVRLYRLF
jgi:hypothetical protein